MNNLDPWNENIQPDPLDLILTGLNLAEPAPGLEARILKTLDGQPLAPRHRQPGIPPSVLLFQRRAIAVALSGVAAIFAFILVTPLRHTRPPFQTALAVAVPNSAPIAVISSQPTVHHRRTRLTSTTGHTVIQLVPANHPARPMPLTEQETLLLRLTRSLNHRQPDSLNLNQQAQLSVQDQFNFDEFLRASLPPPSWPALPEGLPAPPVTTPIL
jgi:hypothetical protein